MIHSENYKASLLVTNRLSIFVEKRQTKQAGGVLVKLSKAVGSAQTRE